MARLAGPRRHTGGIDSRNRLILFELTGADDADTADLLIDDVRLELCALRTRFCTVAVAAGFQAGLVEAELRLSGRSPRRFEITQILICAN